MDTRLVGTAQWPDPLPADGRPETTPPKPYRRPYRGTYAGGTASDSVEGHLCSREARMAGFPGDEGKPWAWLRDWSDVLRNTMPARPKPGDRAARGTYYLIVTPHHRGFYASLAPELQAHVARNAVARYGQSEFLQVTVRDDGSALLAWEYGAIIGSIWLCYIDPATIPAIEEAPAHE